jgi:hypothetical protein
MLTLLISIRVIHKALLCVSLSKRHGTARPHFPGGVTASMNGGGCTYRMRHRKWRLLEPLKFRGVFAQGWKSP